MPVITVGTENSGAIDLHYEDYGKPAAKAPTPRVR
jgi:hypothetical protein